MASSGLCEFQLPDFIDSYILYLSQWPYVAAIIFPVCVPAENALRNVPAWGENILI